MRILALSSLLVLTAAGCGSGGSSAAANGSDPNAPGTGAPATAAVQVVVDTATGADGLLQFVVAAAVFERPDGTSTGNLLSQSREVTFADPSGEASGLLLRAVPFGDYEALHLMLLPGSGSVLLASGAVQAVTGPFDLVIPIADGLHHEAQRASWLAIGHNSGNGLQGTPGQLVWQPQLAGRLDGSVHELVDLHALLVTDAGLTAEVPCVGDGILHVGFGEGCVFTDDASDAPVSLAEFRSTLQDGDDLRVSGGLGRDGRLLAAHVHRGRPGDGPRLIGRVTQLFPEHAAFVMRVQAEVHRGERHLVDPPQDVFVLTQGTRLHRPNQHSFLDYAELGLGDLAKVTVLEYAQPSGLLLIVSARDIEVTGGAGGAGGGGGVPPSPEWHGRVQAVDLQAQTILVEPRNGQGITIGGESVAVAQVQVVPGVPMLRREQHGPATFAIALADIHPGVDLIWWRGTVTGPAAVAANWLRVREH